MYFEVPAHHNTKCIPQATLWTLCSTVVMLQGYNILPLQLLLRVIVRQLLIDSAIALTFTSSKRLQLQNIKNSCQLCGKNMIEHSLVSLFDVQTVQDTKNALLVLLLVNNGCHSNIASLASRSIVYHRETRIEVISFCTIV